MSYSRDRNSVFYPDGTAIRFCTECYRIVGIRFCYSTHKPNSPLANDYGGEPAVAHAIKTVTANALHASIKTNFTSGINIHVKIINFKLLINPQPVFSFTVHFLTGIIGQFFPHMKIDKSNLTMIISINRYQFHKWHTLVNELQPPMSFYPDLGSQISHISSHFAISPVPRSVSVYPCVDYPQH